MNFATDMGLWYRKNVMQGIDQKRQNAPTLIRECIRDCNIQDDANRGNLQVPIWRYSFMTDGTPQDLCSQQLRYIQHTQNHSNGALQHASLCNACIYSYKAVCWIAFRLTVQRLLIWKKSWANSKRRSRAQRTLVVFCRPVCCQWLPPFLCRSPA